MAVISKYFNIIEGGIEFALDGKSALNQAKDKNSYLHISQSSFDLIQDICNRLDSLPKKIKIKWQWVKSHMSDTGIEMSWWEKQNERVDQLAKSFFQDVYNEKEHKPARLWYEHFSIWIDGIKQSSVCKKKLYERLWRENILKYWKTHHDFPIPNPLDIDWEPSRLSIKRLPIGLQRWFTKFTTGFVGNQHKLHQRGDGSAKCPNCPS